MIAVASFSLPGLLTSRDQDGSRLGAEGQSTASTSPSMSVREREKKIGEALTRRLERTRPDLKEVGAGFSWSSSGYKPEVPLQPVRFGQDSQDLYGFVYLTDSIGPTALLVTTGDAVSADQVCRASGDEAVNFCREVRQSDGSVVIEAEFRRASETVKAVSTRTIGDGKRSVVISSYSRNPSTGTGVRQMIPVTVEVLTALVTEPSAPWE